MEGDNGLKELNKILFTGKLNIIPMSIVMMIDDSVLNSEKGTNLGNDEYKELGMNGSSLWLPS